MSARTSHSDLLRQQLKPGLRTSPTSVPPTPVQSTEAKPVVFPYRTMPEAVRDRFAKIGGPEAALRALAKGFKTIAWRKKAEANAREAIRKEDESFGRED